IMGEYLNSIKDRIDFVKPMGGYYYWCEVLGNISLKEMLSISMKRGVDFIPGEFFFSEAVEGENHFRLNFTHSTKEELQKGMEILINIIKK
ncbi:MAG: PLP-dependent aminotransferase family protein, partial [Clostridiales bacterium]|nr:PLP-dependent aminotransferase family protein [Clostridiales bacterium]